MKKKEKIIFVNIIFILFLLVIIDFLSFYIISKKYDSEKTLSSISKNYIRFYSYDKDVKTIKERYILGNNNFYRGTVNNETTNDERPIFFFGCSYMYNSQPEFNETNRSFNILGQFTNRTIYNRARDGFGPANILYIVENEDFYKQIKKEPEFIIYTYISAHLFRMYRPAVPLDRVFYEISYKYNKKTNLLEQKKYTFLNRDIFLLSIIKNKIVEKFVFEQNIFQKKEYNKPDKLLIKYLEQIKSNTDKHWKNSKFVLFVYDNDEMITAIQKQLEEMGFIVIYRKDIAPFEDDDPKYCISKNDPHPNKNAWPIVAPRLIEELKKY